MTKNYILPHAVLVALLAYLETRPYKEVAQGIAALSSLTPAIDELEKDDREASNPNRPAILDRRSDEPHQTCNTKEN